MKFECCSRTLDVYTPRISLWQLTAGLTPAGSNKRANHNSFFESIPGDSSPNNKPLSASRSRLQRNRDMIPGSVSAASRSSVTSMTSSDASFSGRSGRRFNRIPSLFSFHPNKMFVSLPLGERYHVGVRKTGHPAPKGEGNGKRWGARRLFNEQKEGR